MYYNCQQPNACPTGTMPYTIRPGDTFYGIAIRFNTTVTALITANPCVNPNALIIGQIICVPTPFQPCPGGNYYTIRAGDTFYSIARRYNVSLDALLAANPGVNPDALYIGQIICLPIAPPPPPTGCPAGTIAYTVRIGDTFYSIAIRYNVSLDALLRANPNVNPDTLRIGQQICIPTTPVPPPPPPPPPTGCPTGTMSYTIRSGDTFYNLAQRFNTTVEAIMQANPGVDPNRLQIGQQICIPMTTPPPTGCPTGTMSYTIRSGDTFYSLAQRFNTTVDAIIRANPGVDPNRLQIGQQICIPTTTPPPTACPTGTTSYTIRSGDTFFILAQRFNTTVDAIIAANPGVNPNMLQIGQQICIPTT